MITEKGGTDFKKINYKVLDELCMIHCTGEECAAILNIDYDTLNNALKREKGLSFSEYFKLKSAHGKASLRRRQFKAAESGNPTMLIWVGKQWLGQSEKSEPEQKTAEPLNITFNVAEAVKEVKITNASD